MRGRPEPRIPRWLARLVPERHREEWLGDLVEASHRVGRTRRGPGSAAVGLWVRIIRSLLEARIVMLRSGGWDRGRGGDMVAGLAQDVRLGARMLLLDENDRRGAPKVAVVNRTYAARHFPGENPLGCAVPWMRVGFYLVLRTEGSAPGRASGWASSPRSRPAVPCRASSSESRRGTPPQCGPPR